MVKRNQKWLALALGATITVSFGGVQKAWAAPNDIQHQRNLLHNEKSKLSNVKSQEADSLKKLDNLKQQVQDAVDKINKLEASQKKTQTDIANLKQKIQKTQDRINKRKALLEKRIRVMYENGSSVQYLDVLLHSKSFSDFISRAYAVHLIAQQDHNLLEAQKADKKQEEADKSKIQNELKKLQSQLDSLSNMKKQLHQKIDAENKLLNHLKTKDSSIQSRIHSEMGQIKSMQSQVNQSVAHHSSAVATSVPTHFNTGTASGSVSSMIQSSKKWIGHSIYVFGGGRTQAQIQNGVFDCSSFVHWAYTQMGMNIGWSTSSLSHEGSAVSLSSIQPGDLVFFNTYEHNGHVGIYIGGGQFIGAQSSSGVSIASLSNPYWHAHLSGTVRRLVH